MMEPTAASISPALQIWSMHQKELHHISTEIAFRCSQGHFGSSLIPGLIETNPIFSKCLQ